MMKTINPVPKTMFPRVGPIPNSSIAANRNSRAMVAQPLIIVQFTISLVFNSDGFIKIVRMRCSEKTDNMVHLYYTFIWVRLFI